MQSCEDWQEAAISLSFHVFREKAAVQLDAAITYQI